MILFSVNFKLFNGCVCFELRTSSFIIPLPPHTRGKFDPFFHRFLGKKTGMDQAAEPVLTLGEQKNGTTQKRNQTSEICQG